MKKLYFLGVGLVISFSQLHAQAIENVQATLSGRKVLITYNLTTSESDQIFDIEIKSSNDGFATKLVEVTGDVGSNQSAGIGKTITWDARKEMGPFQGDISFEITATVTFTPLLFVQPSAGAGVKIGKSYTVQWKGGTLNRNLKLELLKNNRSVIDLGNIENSGNYTWNVPKTLEKGKNYQLKLLDPTTPNDAVISAQFKLTKISMYVYIGAGVVVAGVAAALILRDKGVDCAANPTDASCPAITTDLAPPPDPPGG